MKKVSWGRNVGLTVKPSWLLTVPSPPGASFLCNTENSQEKKMLEDIVLFH